MMNLHILKSAVKKLLPYSPKKGVHPLPSPGDGREGVSCIQVFPPSSFTLRRSASLDGNVDFPPYTMEVPPYKLFSLAGGKFIFGREEVFSKQGSILEEISAQKVNPLSGKKLDLTPQRKIHARVLVLGLSSLEDEYYHFMVELILRWWIFKSSGLEADYYVFNTGKPFQKEALGLLGIPEDQMLEAGKGEVIQADTLLCPSLVNNFELSHLRGYELYNKLYMPPWSNDTYSFLKERNGLGKAEATKLVYISRNRSSRRKIENEEDLLCILKKFGFTTYYLEEMPLREQAELFASARFVVAPHGAGLVNLVWSRAGTGILELYPEFYHDPGFRILASTLNMDYHYAICKSPGAEALAPVEENIYVDCLEKIEAFLKEKLA
ncbi:MAG: glycosyltransferase family 61 protein [Treponema sp.]|nr:glycosyltransferase family 61 protein [Treponema sp.]